MSSITMRKVNIIQCLLRVIAVWHVDIQQSRPFLQGWWAGCVLIQHSHSHQTPSRFDQVHYKPERYRMTWKKTCNRNMQFTVCIITVALTVLIAILASKLSTQLRTKSTGFPSSSPPLLTTHRITYECLFYWEGGGKTRNHRVGIPTWCGP